MNVVVGTTTTCADVVNKVMEKCHVNEPPIKYQLAVAAKGSTRGGRNGT